MKILQLLIFLLLCALALGWFSRRVAIPYPIVLVIGGGLLGFVPGLPQLEFDPQFVLVLILPPILYQAALLTSWRDFKANGRQIGLLAIGLVIVKLGSDHGARDEHDKARLAMCSSSACAPT